MAAWPGRWDAVLSGPVGPRNEDHRHSAHPQPHCPPPLLLKATQTRVICKDAVVWWGNSVTWARTMAASPGDVPCLGRPEAHWHPGMGTVLLNTWPSCCWDVILPPLGLQSCLKTLFIMKDTHSCACSDACNDSPTTSKVSQLRLHRLTRFQLCPARGSLRSSTASKCRDVVSFWDFFPSN